jgi:hypothetical protein
MNMKYYNGTELKWSAEDVMNNAEHLSVELNEEEALDILNATFKDNERLMELIAEMISDSILTFNALKTNKLKDNELH